VSLRKCLRLTFLVATLFAIVPLTAAPARAQGTVIATDDFNRPDEAPFSPTGNWGRVVAGNYDGFANLTDGTVHSASNEGIYYWSGAGTFSNTRQFARQRVVQKDGELGLVLLGGPDHSIMVGWGPPGVGSTVYIYWYSGGVDRGQLATGPSTVNNGDTIEAVLEAGRIYAKVNGVTVLSVANTTTLTSGTPGFITYLNPGLPAEVAILDDWEAGTPPSYSISGTITEAAAGLSGVLVTASGGFSGSATTDGSGVYTIAGVPAEATAIVLTPTLSGHTMSPLSLNVTGPVNANVTGQDFTSTPTTDAVLTVFASHGSVTRDPDQATYPLGAYVTLTAIPDGGYTFTGWSGDVAIGQTTDNPLIVTMDQDRTLTASFLAPNVIASDDFNRPNETPFSVGGNWQQPFGGGSANLTGQHVAGVAGDALYYWQGSGTFDNTRQFARAKVVQASGQVGLVLLGAPNQAMVVAWNAGTLYFYWYSGGAYQGNLTTVPSTLQNGDVIEAVLEAGTFSAKINGAVVGSVANTTTLTGGRPGFETYQSGASFDDWEAGTGQSYAISGTITEAAIGLSGVLVTVTGGFTGSATTDGSGAYTIAGVPPEATSIVLTPTRAGHTMSPLSLTVDGPVNANVTGQDFTSTPNTDFVLTVLATHGSVTKDPDLATYPLGTDVTLTATPDGGYTFTGWSGDVPVGHANDNPLVVTMDQDRTLTAGFEPPNVIASDDFNRANETPFAVGGNWQQPFGGGTANLTSQHVAGVAAEALYYWQGSGTFDNTSQFARAKVLQAGGQVGVVLLGATNQALVVAWGGGRLYIYWYLNGSHQGELANEAMILHDGDTIEGELDHGLIRAKINGVTVKTVANTTSLTAGKPGFETYQSGAVFDDWEAGTPQSYTISGTVTEEEAGLGGVLVTASGGFSGSATTDGTGAYTIAGVPAEATSIVLTPTLSGHAMSPLSRNVAGPVNANVTGQDFTSTPVVEPATASDDFNRADETPLAVGGNWQQPFGGGSVNLASQHVVSAAGEALYYWQGLGAFDNAHQFARLKVDQASGQVGLVLLGAPNQALVVAWNAGTLYFYWYSAGTYRGNLTTVASTLQDGDMIEAVLEAGTIYAKINGAVFASVANTTTLTSGHPGFETFQTGASFDDWEGGTVQRTIVASAGAGGTITPNGSVLVTHGTDQTFTISPASCYAIADVSVDGSSVGPVTSYTFTNVASNHTVAASFAAILSAGATHVDVSCDGESNGSIDLTVTGGTEPYAFLWSNGATEEDLAVLAAGTYDVTITDAAGCTASTSVTVGAGEDPAIAAEVRGSGSVSPSGSTVVSCGGDLALTFTPDPGFQLVSVLIDNVSIGPVPGYTFTNVTRPHTIIALFGQTTGVGATPLEFSLGRPSPNPARGRASFEFAVARTAKVRLSVLDVTGHEVAVLAEGTFSPGRYPMTWDGLTAGNRAAPGVYFLRYQKPGGDHIQRLILMR